MKFPYQTSASTSVCRALNRFSNETTDCLDRLDEASKDKVRRRRGSSLFHSWLWQSVASRRPSDDLLLRLWAKESISNVRFAFPFYVLFVWVCVWFWTRKDMCRISTQSTAFSDVIGECLPAVSDCCEWGWEQCYVRDCKCPNLFCCCQQEEQQLIATGGAVLLADFQCLLRMRFCRHWIGLGLSRWMIIGVTVIWKELIGQQTRND